MSEVMSEAATLRNIEMPAPRDAQAHAGTEQGAKRGKIFLILFLVIAIAGAAWGSWWHFVGSRYVSTEDAYVNAEVAQITPRVEGTLETVPVHDTQKVAAGEVLATLDQTDAKIAVAQAEAGLARAKQRVDQYFANVDSAKAQGVARASDSVRAQTDYDRRQALASSGAVSGEEVTSARNALQSANAARQAAEHQLKAQEALVAGADTDHNPEVLAAKAVLDKAQVDLDRTVIRAPVDGVITQNTAQIGQHVKPDGALMTVVPIGHVYVDANFKEGQLDRVRPGQSVTLTSDVYGSGVVFHGQVEGLGGGTGSALAVIPAQNATGNWIKVVQRLAVRVRLDPNELAEHSLRVGLSMTVRVELQPGAARS
jgi:membrane fusion protein (multidrug efflux system)